jgi:phosphoenolpyruvate synthase/pyruvate phosphate dikinase
VPALAQRAAALPAAGVGLLRAEFLALGAGRHPRAILEAHGEDAYVQLFQDGIEEVASAFHPRPVTYRACDLKSNEYRGLEGGEEFEPVEANPMIGARGAYRYLVRPHEFALELRAVAQARDRGHDNVRLMLPFVRTVAELRELAALVRPTGIELWTMAEVPATALLPRAFAREVDGVSIGSNDLVALVLGVDRDSPELARRYGTNDPAVTEALRNIIEGAHAEGRPVCICGDQPSTDAALVRTLVELEIDAISVVPDAFEPTRALLHELGA